MEDNKTKEEILDQEATEACLTPTQRQLVLSAMEVHTQQSTKHLQDELDSWKKEHFEMVEDAANTIKELQDRIAELTKVLDTCEKTFELLNQIVFNLKAAADGDNLKDMVEAVDIDFPLIQAKIKDTLLNTKS